MWTTVDIAVENLRYGSSPMATVHGIPCPEPRESLTCTHPTVREEPFLMRL